jgi:predicted transcriptional regulator
MGRKIPRPIRVQVIKAWLDAKSRDKIAQELEISPGAVSSIIKDFREDDHEFDLLREVAVKIKGHGMDVESFASLVRLYKFLSDKGLLTGITGLESHELMQSRMEALIVALEVLCYKTDQSIEDFVSLITNMYSAADKLAVPLDKFPAYITELKDRIDAQRKEIDQTEAKKQQALKDFDTTLELLQEYNANKPFVLRLQNYKQELAEKEQQLAEKEEKIRKLEEELENVKSWNAGEEIYTWSISEDAFNKVRTELVPDFELSPLKNFDTRLDSRVVNVKEMVMDLVRHPSMYPGIFRQIRDVYASRYKLGTRESGVKNNASCV